MIQQTWKQTIKEENQENRRREFVQDLRPEYMLHASNVLESLKTGQRLSDLNAKTFSEFREGYPEAFTVSDISRLEYLVLRV